MYKGGLYDARGYVSAETFGKHGAGHGSCSAPFQAGWHVQKASPTYKPIGATSVASLAKRGRQGLNNTIPRNINKSWKQHEVTAQGKHKANKHKGQTRSTRKTSTRGKQGAQGKQAQGKHKGKTRSTRGAQERHTRQQQQQQEEGNMKKEEEGGEGGKVALALDFCLPACGGMGHIRPAAQARAQPDQLQGQQPLRSGKQKPSS